jgi:hypothetical protein
MKKFFLMTILAAVFFTCLGGMLQETTAKFKSDEKALALLAKARQAIGGDTNLAGVNSLTITGKSTRTLKFDGVERVEQGDMELAMQFPDKMMKMIKMGHEGANGEKTINKQVDVVMVASGEPGNFEWKTEGGEKAGLKGEHTFVIKTDDDKAEAGQVTSGQKVILKKIDDASGGVPAGADKNVVFNKVVKGEGHGEFAHQSSGLLRTALSLLLTAPQGMDVAYLYGGEGNVDGAACNIIDAQFGGSSIKLYLGKDSNLPVMMSFQEAKPMTFFFKMDKGEAQAAEKSVKTFERHAGPTELSEFQVRFSDYRSVNGVSLPYKWVQTVGGQPDETIEVGSYEINPANINDKFSSAGGTKVFMRKAKEQ